MPGLLVILIMILMKIGHQEFKLTNHVPLWRHCHRNDTSSVRPYWSITRFVTLLQGRCLDAVFNLDVSKHTLILYYNKVFFTSEINMDLGIL